MPDASVQKRQWLGLPLGRAAVFQALNLKLCSTSSIHNHPKQLVLLSLVFCPQFPGFLLLGELRFNLCSCVCTYVSPEMRLSGKSANRENQKMESRCLQSHIPRVRVPFEIWHVVPKPRLEMFGKVTQPSLGGRIRTVTERRPAIQGSRPEHGGGCRDVKG